ncbi:prolyl oligopeptidase family serine peptidase [Sphingobacterium paramultivorum]|uniref:Prolyl oligopeptidase family serine peptidase n=1 Tax=Sphingobacterium paramultivorum TaxID=2886510 RepID=A0A7G5E082_9SPHI|nr:MULTISPECIES: prolyl oligopeptidase family serine peptidase [Sphingobacterium]MCS4164572.1 putative peptidase [Sphingobacterium sp. BIGb0116]QMV67407.1 prolyl oligopeptidase family serine peptidase [Sphingobacterium paramultivorum]WSO16272.1 prolyl oligopeptidase family serine peptidase [Sphingobacterium paramultivorum]
MRKVYLYICFFFMLLMRVNAQEIHAIKGETAYPFLLKDAALDSLESEKQPVFVFLHGRSLSGTNLDRVKRYGVLYAINKGQEVPGIIVAPQSRGGWDPDKVIEIIDYVIEHYNADPDRIYVCGMSMGGYGTMDVAGKYPERVAAAVAICGGGSSQYASNLTQVPIWLHHGTADRAVPISESRKIMNAIKREDPDANVSLNVIKGGTHGSVERLFHDDAIYNWMLKFKKKHKS